MNASEPTPVRYMPQLDGLRALAVFAVTWSHWMADPKYHANIRWGHIGVQLFFVLSGFLITGILLRGKPAEGESRGPCLKQFYIRRSLRIFPAYYLFLGITWLVDFNDTRAMIGWHASYTTSIYLFLTKRFSNTSHFWTLSVEEQFYLIWPWVVLWTSRRTLLQIVIGMIIGTPVFQVIVQSFFPHTEPTMLMPGAADALGVGALLALVESREDWKRALRSVQVFACLPIFLILQGEVFFKGGWLSGAAESVRETAMVVTFSLLVSLAATGFRGPLGSALSHPLLTGVGKISYGIYLFHNCIPHLMTWVMNLTPIGSKRYYQMHELWRFAGFWVLTLVLAGASWFLVERPCLRLKDRWGKSEQV